MTDRLHDTDRILAVLGEAIEQLRTWGRNEWWPSEADETASQVANDLALLHGAVTFEAERHDVQVTAIIEEALAKFPLTVPPDQVGHAFHPAGRDRKPGWQGRALLRSVRRDEIQDEVYRGEHREDD